MLVSLALVLMACQLTHLGAKQTATPDGAATSTTPASGAIATPGSAEQITPTDAVDPTGQADSTARPMPKQSQAAIISPKNMRMPLTHLSNLIGYEVLDVNGDKLGVASDYIVNACEGYVIYILITPAASLHIPAGQRVVIPFEAVTINSGVLNAQNKTIQLNVVPQQFAGAPTIADGKDLLPTDWEAATKAFWRKSVRVGMLATSCNVSGGPTYKVAYATQLLAVKLYDGRKALLGTLEEAILEPESGQIHFYVVKPAKGDGLVLVSLGVTNIPAAALAPGGTLSLVLLAQPEAFWGAPKMTEVSQADDYNLQGKMRGYWGR
jgi:sporulation protein YlmC with PRC-barrel domain